MLVSRSSSRRSLLPLVRHVKSQLDHTRLYTAQTAADGARASHTAVPPRPGPPLAATVAAHQYGTYFQARTRKIAHALAHGEHIPRNLLLKILAHRNISPDSLALWVDVLARRDPIYALEKLGLLESAGGEMPYPNLEHRTDRPDCPDWLYLALPGLISERSHVPYLASQVLSTRFARLDEQKRALFVSRCLQHFLRVRHYVALRELVEWVAWTPREDPTALAATKSFEAVLAALASERTRAGRHDATPPLILDPLVKLVLSAYSRRHVDQPPTYGMYKSLLSPKLIPREPDSALRLLARMTQDGHTPSKAISIQVAKICARDGRHAAALRLLEQVRGRLDRGDLERTGLPAELERFVGEEPMNRAPEIPLHLRGWSTDQFEREFEAGNVAEADESTLTLDEVEGDSTRDVRVRDSGRITPIGSDSMTPTAELSSATSAIEDSPASVRRASSQDFAETLVLLDRDRVMPYFHRILAFATSSATAIDSQRPSFPAPPQDFDRVAWAQFFHTCSLQSDVGADQLIAALQCVARASSAPSTSTAYVPPPPSLRLYTVVLQALVRREEPRAALHLWRFIEKRGWRPDATLLDAVVRAHLALEHDRPALRLLEAHAAVESSSPAAAVGDAAKRPPTVCLSVTPFNALLAFYSQRNRFDAAYRLYQELGPRFGVGHDSATLSIMLDAARHASTRAGRGWNATTAFEEMSAATPVFGGALAAHRSGAASSTPIDDTWDGEPASKRFEQFLRHDVLELNHQNAKLEAPWEERGVVGWLASRLRRAHDSTAIDRKPGGFFGRKQSAPPPAWHPFASTLSPTPPPHPHLFATDRVFRSLIRLVGTHSSVTSIPNLLSWMHYLHVQPSRFTLCVAMAYVDGEASFRPAQMERLSAWLADWLGEEAIPTQAEIAWMRRGGKQEGRPMTRTRP
ncbi:hypothetical protein BMF94_3911 [Rhodotorula taiwanensis]|uniref:Uncharacterized protein n=1 Tax=Rhodotorula taiwanensis TaxID=741276 RepID=A0A2S5B8H2_9BASI|nr:hypothetical protein BMF94_3911 [Rhodotorula taiwanensis]